MLETETQTTRWDRRVTINDHKMLNHPCMDFPAMIAYGLVSGGQTKTSYVPRTEIIIIIPAWTHYRKSGDFQRQIFSGTGHMTVGRNDSYYTGPDFVVLEEYNNQHSYYQLMTDKTECKTDYNKVIVVTSVITGYSFNEKLTNATNKCQNSSVLN